MLKHGSFILIIDGIDGSGKNTLTKEISKYMNENKDTIKRWGVPLKIETHSFPNYNSLVGETILNLLNIKNKSNEIRKSLVNLFVLDRQLHSLNNTHLDVDVNTFAIFDRYYPSNLAYNLNMNVKDLMKLEEKSFMGDLVIIVDVPVDISFDRRPNRRDEYEKDHEYLEKVRNSYLTLANDFGWTVVDGTKNPRDLAYNIVDKIIHSYDGFKL